MSAQAPHSYGFVRHRVPRRNKLEQDALNKLLDESLDAGMLESIKADLNTILEHGIPYPTPPPPEKKGD